MSEACVVYNVRHLETKQKFQEYQANLHSGKVLRSDEIVFKDEVDPDIYFSEMVVKIEPKTEDLEEDFKISIANAESKPHAVVCMANNLMKQEAAESIEDVPEVQISAGDTAGPVTGIIEDAAISTDWNAPKVKIEPQTELEEDLNIGTIESHSKQADDCNTEIYRGCFKRENSVDIEDTNIGTEDEVSYLKEQTISRKQSVQCEICNKTYHYAANYEKHMKRKHARTRLKIRMGAKPYLSDESEEGYIPSRDIKIHKTIHAGAKPYECYYCPKTFGTKNNLRLHIRTHTNEKPHVCGECGKNFISSSKLELHKRTHTGERPYECQQCTKKFTTSSKLQLHKRSHTGEKPYQCSQCTKTFISSTKLNLHMRTHTGERPYKCLHCDKTFAYTYGRYRHQKTHAKENSQITEADDPRSEESV